jgi:hypothetical protein
MSAWLRRSIWFGRFVVGGAALMMTRIGAATLIRPVEDAERHGITLGSPDGVTVMRVEGAIFIALAALLAYCVASEKRLSAGLGMLVTVITSITAARLLGLVMDGPGPFTLMVLKPEIVLVVLSTCALLVEQKRRRHAADAHPTGGAWHPSQEAP